MINDNEALSWGKCKVVVDDVTIIAQIQDGSTNLNTEQGEKKEAVIEGGEVIRVRYQRNKHTLEFVEFGKASISNVDGVVAGNHKIKLICCDDGIDREVFTIPSAVINIQSGFTSEYGTMSTYSCSANRQANGSSIIWADVVDSPVISFNSSGKMVLTAEDGVDIYYTTDGSVPSSSSTKYTAPVTLSGGSYMIHAIAIKTVGSNTYYSGVTCYQYDAPNRAPSVG